MVRFNRIVYEPFKTRAERIREEEKPLIVPKGVTGRQNRCKNTTAVIGFAANARTSNDTVRFEGSIALSGIFGPQLFDVFKD